MVGGPNVFVQNIVTVIICNELSHYHTCQQSFLLEHNVWPRFTKHFYGYDFWRQGFLKFICHFKYFNEEHFRDTVIFLLSKTEILSLR